jgi:cardiolipin synthase
VRGSPSWLTIPNLLSLVRVALTPLAVSTILRYDYDQALGVFVVAGITDALDGHLARKYDWRTAIGAWLDPIADKVLLVAVYVALGVVAGVPRWLAAIVVGRDVLILLASAAIMLASGRRRFPPSVWGKISTTLQMVTAVVVIAAGVFSPPQFHRLVAGLVWTTAAATVWSGLHYGWLGLRMLRNPIEES